jgi:hypothetical protein
MIWNDINTGFTLVTSVICQYQHSLRDTATMIVEMSMSHSPGVPSENLRPDGTTVHPRRTPVKPAYFEKEFTSIATSLAPSIS